MNGQSDYTPPHVTTSKNGDFVLDSNRSENAPAPKAPATSSSDKVVMNYSTDFPSLPVAAPVENGNGNTSVWKKPLITSSNVTQLIKLSPDERAARGFKRDGITNPDENKKCKEIASATNCQIELALAKDGSLNIMISGKRNNVDEAHGKLLRELQTQGTREIKIPKEHFGAIIGKEGSVLKKMEQEYFCRINMPGKDGNKDTIKITGPGNYVDTCAEKILQISNERSKQHSEHLSIPKNFFPWIRGASNCNLERWTNDGNVKVSIPPSSVENGKIHVSGERNGVVAVVDEIKKIHAFREKFNKNVCTSIPRCQRKFILGNRGSGIQEILKETGCFVEVPPEEDETDVINVYGEQDKIIQALALIYSRAASICISEVEAPQWIHKHLIGPKGATLQAMFPSKEKLKIEFTENNSIYLEGPPAEVNPAKTLLTSKVEEFLANMDSRTIKVPVSYHRHLVGKAGSNISKLREEFEVNVIMPNENTNSEEIGIEGKKDGVAKCIKQIQETVKKMENEKSKDVIIEQRFHKNIIGNKGESINKIRQQYPSVTISVPDINNKSDIINIRGEKAEVDKVAINLTKVYKELLENNYQESVPIFKEFHKHIIGKGGLTINKLREETGTRIEVPLDGSSEDKIIVTGKKDNVIKAVAQLTSIQNEQANIITVDVPIPAKAKARFSFSGRRLLTDIEKECENVFFSLPKDKVEKIVIRGPKEFVGKAEVLVKDLLNNLNENTEETTISAPSNFHKFIIGKNGAKVKKIREEFPTVRILFPDDKDDNSETIHIVGKKNEVKTVQGILEKQIAELKETTEEKMDVDHKYYKNFFARNSELLKDIQSSNGNVQIFFPKSTDTSNVVSIKGSKDCVEAAKAKILEVVDDIKAQTTISVHIDNKHFRTILSQHKGALAEISKKWNVRVKFPERNAAPGVNENGENIADTVTITGNSAKVESAKEDLLSLVPATESVEFPREHHRSLIGRGGEGIRKLQGEYNVSVHVPQEKEESDTITVTGLTEQVAKCIEHINGLLSSYENIAEERKLRSYSETVTVPHEYHIKLIGRKGATVNEMRNKFDVQISFPKDGQDPEGVVITGLAENVAKCKEEIEKIVKDLDSLIHWEVEIHPAVHAKFIGTGGRQLRKLNDDYDVDIRMPGKHDPNPTLVLVSGMNEDSIKNCIEYMKQQEEDFIAVMEERNQFVAPVVAAAKPKTERKAFEIHGAPWENNQEHFPSMSTVAPQQQLSGVWGNRNRINNNNL